MLLQGPDCKGRLFDGPIQNQSQTTDDETPKVCEVRNKMFNKI